MRNLGTRCFSVTLLSLLLTVNAVAQLTPRPIGQTPKRVTVAPPRLKAIQLMSRELVVVDLAGNGIDLTGGVRTSLVTGSLAPMRWTKPNSDDAIVIADATALRAAGLSLTTAAGVPLEGSVFLRGGLMATDASGSSSLASTSLDLLARLDANRDGKINASDPAWSALRLFRDADADGAIGAAELTPIADVLQSLDATTTGAAANDALGTQSVSGVARLRDGTAVAMAYAKLAAID